MISETSNKSFVRNPAAADLVWDALEALSEGIAVYDSEYRLVTCNQRYVDMFPLISDLIDRGASWSDLLRAGAERGQYREAMGRVDEWIAGRLKNDVPIGQILEIELTNGCVYEVQFSATKNNGFVVANTDITERRQAEIATHERETLLRTVLEASPVAVVMARQEDGHILYRSPEAVRFFGDTKNALEHYADRQDRQDYVDTLHQVGHVDDYRITLRNAQGRLCPTTSWGRLITFDGETYVVTAIIDMTDQHEREEMIRHVLEACPAPIQMTRARTGEVLFSSPETIALFGRVESAKQFYVDPDARATYLARLNDQRSIQEYKAKFFNAKGAEFWGAVSARIIPYNGEDVIVSHTRDMTEQLRIEAELAQQQDQLYQNDKMSAMGELLAGVAHELNNPLSVVVGHSLMLREDCTEPEILRQVDKISTAAERCSRIVKTFLTMARQQPVKMQCVDINEIVQTAMDVARFGDAGEGLSMTCDLALELPEICADPDQITQVIINLILNAEQAIHESGKGARITLETRLSQDGAAIEILVEDDGPGIAKNIRSRIFEPFFTTKDVGEGTGIGLALCHRIIGSHGGQITLTDQQDGGSLFNIQLPVQAAGSTSESTERATGQAQPFIRVLIVDDEEDVAELNAEILTRAGYQVDVFNQAERAIESLSKHDYGLILSDLNMPQLDGRGFFETIQTEFPDMVDKIAFVTGDTMGRASQTFLRDAQRPCIEKPVSPKELRAFVSELIAEGAQ
ncbi:ATP-binding protein [Roseovarius sp. EL26]|uniref:hybrid sensor histidine kinase/response regulator n=1 Tax=Roseovarius sp. EL26 TaxID=2126672 RepID=UPI000EA013EB|nr:ATP-binding protein [Roseovarius sp. EL26]